MADARVTVGVEVDGIAQARQEVQRVSELAARPAPGAARMLSSATMGEQLAKEGRATAHLGLEQVQSLLQRTRAELSKIYTDMDRILGSGSPAARHYHELLNRGFVEPYAFRRTVQGGLPGAGQIEQLASLRGEATKLEAIERRLDAGLKDGIYQAHDRAFAKWIPQLGRMIGTTLSLAGIGSAIGIAMQMRGAAREYFGASTEGAIGMGLNANQAQSYEALGLRGPGRFALNPMQRIAISNALLGGFGRRGLFDADATDRFAGMGLGLGMGREGLARMAGEMSMTAFTPDRAGMMGAERFGMAVLGASSIGGLTQTQKQFYLESNRNLIELMTRFTGGQPLNAETFVAHFDALRQAVSGLGLVGGGIPQAASLMRGAAQLVPMGGSTGDIFRTGMLLGFSPEEAMARGQGNIGLGYTQLVADLVKPEGMPDLLQRLGRLGGVSVARGRRLGGEEMNRIGMAARDIMKNPALAETFQTPGGVEMWNAFLTAQPGEKPALGKAAQTEMDRVAAVIAGTTGGKAASADAEYITKGIDKVGEKIVSLESTVKKMLGPVGAGAVGTGTSIITSLLPSILAFFGARAGGAGLSAMLGGVASSPWLAIPGAAAVGYGIGSLISPYMPDIGGALYDKLHGTVGGDNRRQRTIAAGIAAARRHGIDPLRFLAMGERESNLGLNQNVSSAGARGPWQIMPANIAAYGMKDPENIEENADVAARLFKEQIQTSKGDINRATSIYAGYGGRLDTGAMEYIKGVEKNMERLANELGRNTDYTRANTEAAQAEARAGITAMGTPNMTRAQLFGPDR